ASSSSGTVRATPPRWPTSSSSTSSPRPRESARRRRSEQRAEAGRDAADDDAREGDDPERSHERVAEKAPAQVGEHEKLETDDGAGEEQRDRIVRDEERERVQDPAE